MAKRFLSVGIENTEENRRKYRQLLFSTPGFEAYISGIILFEETLYQKSDCGASFVDIIKNKGLQDIVTYYCADLHSFLSS